MFFFKSYPNLTVIIACLFWGTYWIPLRYMDNNNNASVWPLFLSFLLLPTQHIKKYSLDKCGFPICLYMVFGRYATNCIFSVCEIWNTERYI